MPSLQQKKEGIQKNIIKKMQTNLRLPLEPSIKQNLRKRVALEAAPATLLLKWCDSSRYRVFFIFLWVYSVPVRVIKLQ